MSLGLNGPEGLAFDSSGYLWVANFKGNNLLQINTKTSAVVQTISGLNGPSRLACVTSGGNTNVWVTHTSGATVNRYPGGAALLGSFQRPLGVAVDPTTGNIWVADNQANTIQGFGSNLNPLGDAIPKDSAGTAFTAPGALAFEGDCLFVGLGPGVGMNSVLSYEVTHFNPYPPTLASPTIYTNSVNTGPTGITFDNEGNVYVADLYSGSFAGYQISSTPGRCKIPGSYRKRLCRRDRVGECNRIPLRVQSAIECDQCVRKKSENS